MLHGLFDVGEHARQAGRGGAVACDEGDDGAAQGSDAEAHGDLGHVFEQAAFDHFADQHAVAHGGIAPVVGERQFEVCRFALRRGGCGDGTLRDVAGGDDAVEPVHADLVEGAVLKADDGGARHISLARQFGLADAELLARVAYLPACGFEVDQHGGDASGRIVGMSNIFDMLCGAGNLLDGDCLSAFLQILVQ